MGNANINPWLLLTPLLPSAFWSSSVAHAQVQSPPIHRVQPTKPEPQRTESFTEYRHRFLKGEPEGDEGTKAHSPLAVYGQLLGSSVVLGLGVDHRPAPALSVRGGVGVVALCSFECAVGPTFSVGGSVLAGSGNHMFEAGVELFLGVVDLDVAGAGGPMLGYRYQPRAGGVFFRATAQLLIAILDDNEPIVLPYPGLSIGYAFEG